MQKNRALSGLRDRVCVVTGSSRGIGRETARFLLAQGAKVVLNGRTREALAETEALLQADIPRTGGSSPERRLLAVAADVSTEEGARFLVEETLKVFGRLDYLINNAGVSMRGAIEDLREPALDRLYRGNLLSAVLPTVAALPELKKTGGTVLFVSTVGALWGFPGISIYSATKAAVERFCQSLDAEYRSAGVKSRLVFLGFVENDPHKETLAADGTSFRHNRKAQQTQQEAARAIVSALTGSRQRVITIPAGRALSWAKRCTPSLVARILARNRKSFHRVTKNS
ncbi:Short-chain dehydrogenase [Alkalispirochaeta americana]|uniref:Short-chain dehydrogenase n=1 Tax=Alkalispirochaeta americana TaxID=159291 RepID=A0A1N6SWE8_9SPIO|nr:SDR family NAD(P)-dependent oxidoreductase [Alkalispirochaeta americana]SIQ45429.1 Short-chain dehydrogenase [Alkalispirochaeta americana]